MVRTRLRIKSNAFDEAEIRPLIEAAKQDLRRVGVYAKEDDPMAVQAIVLYCKANFGFSQDEPRWQTAYEALRDAMALSGDYAREGREEADADVVS